MEATAAGGGRGIHLAKEDIFLYQKSNAAQSLIEDYAACLELRSEESQTIEDTKYDIGVLIIQLLIDNINRPPPNIAQFYSQSFITGFANYKRTLSASSLILGLQITDAHHANLGFPLASVTSLADPFPLPSVDTNNLKWVKSYKRTRVPFFPVVQISRLHVPLESKYLEPVILDTLHVFLIGLFSWEMETVTSMNTYRECNCSVTLLVSSVSYLSPF
ncbi:hypothetical protein C5167_004552 [Papaver somniferum]|uniref:Uncharacterized protein n=1 Tax=Papaver somniferum TaxID=3469 RepID=A0A4Y7JBX8_PAPSO|nr:hypothetical protein C5167_004552 [Papaver somniferum]